ncbi:MAG TPA: hypothetical protein PKM73_10360 [Verrucomicrobiota bacterium]|nr:hypothetical protein [Verrucomicrobiota bacterium]HNU51071.1 hypothetical protein [Verrucomicrobiota bacterium]
MPDHEYDLVGQRRLADDDLAEAAKATNEYSVSLINGNSLVGSGTLVSIGRACGILTADHVWQAVKRGEAKDHFCLVLGSELQRFEYSFQECTPVIVGEYSSQHAEAGPDLAFIRLDNLLKLGTIRSRKSFFPLEAQKGKIFDQMPVDRCPWLVWGAPDEKSRRFSTESGEPILKLTHFAGASEFSEKVDREGFDYVKVRIPSGDGNFPSRYGGVSGGGVWIPFRLSEDPKGQVLKTNVSLLLAGVAYYEIEEEPRYMTLLLHGPKSVYGRVIDEVLQRCP